MGRINILDSELSNKIAAGEVVERPASVIKELVENAIDAGATKISVEIKNGGNTYMKVTDNGCGMEKDDAAVAFLRHATSKISVAEDLARIYTLGFRGEALSSIGAVSIVDLYTKRCEDDFGTHTVCEGGEIISAEDAGIPDGTTFIVKNLFYNVPARMKFLKKDATESGYISDIMSRFILAHPEISFKFTSNGKPVLYSAGDNNPVNAVYAVYGKDYARAMLPVMYATEYVKVTGLIGKNTTSRANRSYQSFFVNKRYIKSPLIMRAVEEGYKNQIMIGKFPTAILNIEINPSLVDINVHPTKLEVKFSNESEIYRAVFNAVKETLYKICDIPEIKRTEKKDEKPVFVADKTVKDGQIQIEEKPLVKHEEKSEQRPLSEEIKKENSVIKEETIAEKTVTPEIKKENISSVFENKQTVLNEPKMFDYKGVFEEKEQKPENVIKQTEVIKKETDENIIDEGIKKQEIHEEIKEEIKAEEIKPQDKNFKLIGQIFDTYIIFERGDKMQIMDQHAAHERLKYEELKKALEDRKLYKQDLLIPAVVNLTSTEMAVFAQNTECFASLGFDAEEFDSNSVIIRAIPANSENEDISSLFVELLSQVEDNKREIITEKRQRLLYTIACKAAIKANHKMSEDEQKRLVEDVINLENINTCPHGRPIIISMSEKELEKEFKRIV